MTKKGIAVGACVDTVNTWQRCVACSLRQLDDNSVS